MLCFKILSFQMDLFMKIIIPANNKGGVGKTKISILLAEYISMILKKKVLAIDLDPQCNFSQRFLNMEIDPSYPEGKIPPIHPDYDPYADENKDWDGRSSIADIFTGKGVLPYPTYIENLDIAPACAGDLINAEMQRRNEIIENVHKRLNLFLQLPEVKKEYEVAVIDTAPSKGPLTISAFKAATHIIIPSIMEEQPIQGIFGMLHLWKQESLSRPTDYPLKLIGILPNMFRNVNLHKDMLDSLNENEAISKYIIPLQLRQRTIFAEVDAEGAVPATIFNLPDSNLAKQEAMEVCKYITDGVF